MSTEVLITGNSAAAWAARLARVDYVPAYPITPQTEIIETIAKWVREGQMDAKLVLMESEHSMLTAAGTASLAGARVFTATSSQGLLYGLEMLYNISGWRAPMVLINVSRGLAAPITLEPDQNDVLATRDSGFLQFHAETCQEVADLTLLAYRVAEDRSVALPAVVNEDGFYLSFTRERVKLPDPRGVKDFLPDLEIESPFRGTRPVAKGTSVMSGALYSYFKYQMHIAAMRAAVVFEEAADEFEELFGRKYSAVEEYMLEDAEYVLVMSDSFATLGKQAVKKLRGEGFPAGLLKLRLFRPFPSEDVRNALKGRKGVAVFDQNIAPGSGGIIYPEVASTLYHERDRPNVLMPVIGGLGGKRLSREEMELVFMELKKRSRIAPGVPETLYLLEQSEWEAARQSVAVANTREA